MDTESGKDGKCLPKVNGPVAKKGQEREDEEIQISKSTSVIDLLAMNISLCG
jgi:hypothetical protein